MTKEVSLDDVLTEGNLTEALDAVKRNKGSAGIDGKDIATEQQAPKTLWAVCSRRLIENMSSQIQPPDTENRMSGGVGGVTNAISLSRPDQFIVLSTVSASDTGAGMPIRRSVLRSA